MKNMKKTGFNDEKLQSLIESSKGEKTVEALASVLLQMGFEPEMLKKAKLGDVIKFQKHLLDKEKLGMEQEKHRIALSRLLSGEVIWQEGVEEEAKLIGKRLEAEELEAVPVTEIPMDSQTDGE